MVIFMNNTAKDKYLRPSIRALERRVGFKGDPDHTAELIRPKTALSTCGRGAYELLKWDPSKLDLYVYVDDIRKVASEITQNGCKKGDTASIYLMQKEEELKNPFERVYMDCIAKGGRDLIAAAYLEIHFPKKIGNPLLSREFVKEVRETSPKVISLSDLICDVF